MFSRTEILKNPKLLNDYYKLTKAEKRDVLSNYPHKNNILENFTVDEIVSIIKTLGITDYQALSKTLGRSFIRYLKDKGLSSRVRKEFFGDRNVNRLDYTSLDSLLNTITQRLEKTNEKELKLTVYQIRRNIRDKGILQQNPGYKEPINELIARFDQRRKKSRKWTDEAIIDEITRALNSGLTLSMYFKCFPNEYEAIRCRGLLPRLNPIRGKDGLKTTKYERNPRNAVLQAMKFKHNARLSTSLGLKRRGETLLYKFVNDIVGSRLLCKEFYRFCDVDTLIKFRDYLEIKDWEDCHSNFGEFAELLNQRNGGLDKAKVFPNDLAVNNAFANAG